ncbi:hypothetical protein WALSEDRAFT_65826 [Wallemia mellicola CBS 633.66]|uniref:Protein transport protein sec16 n=1 Tax=Wallemia mellicola (strain ATCC MYA-4683 / CBS 633.66) TaxID=671144 RepID=I4Y7U1_WALMC|nr:hypothetical protein WALSEDRAFT_65826 [Wallemia mellicola CBS 633.66]EIM20033.1 hypothetical protein WALSEDRAFT_65826 [Wallemia mellicola CBS 633.66]|eukprot:XP_006959962.1 hypothetical protein WALSEDRAFT_65826 [Wallemia mellicola CBS 633.66]
MAEEPPASPKSAKFFIPEGVYFIEGYGYGYYDLNNQWVYWYPSDSDYYERDTVESKDKENGRDFFDALYTSSLDSPAAPPQHQQQQLQQQQQQQQQPQQQQEQDSTLLSHPQHTPQQHDLFANTPPHDSFQLATHHHSSQLDHPSQHETPTFLQPPTDSVQHQDLPFDAPNADVYPPPPAFLEDDQPPFLQQECSPQPTQQDLYTPQEVPQEPMFLQEAYTPQQSLYPTQPMVPQQQLHEDTAQFDPYVPLQQDSREITHQEQHQLNPYGPPVVEQPKHNVEPYAPPPPVMQQASQARTENVGHVEVHEEVHHVDAYAPPVVEKAVHQDPYDPLTVVQPGTYEQPQQEVHQVDPYATAPVVDQAVQEPSQPELQQTNPYAPAPTVEQVPEPSQPEVQQMNPYAPPPAAQQGTYQIDPYAPVEAPEIQQKAPPQQNPYAPQPPSIQRDPYSPQPASLQREAPQLDVYSPPPASLHKQVPTQLLQRDPYSPQTLQQEDLYAPQSNSLKQQGSHYTPPAALQQDLYSPKYQKQPSLQSPPSVQQGYLPGPPPPATQHAAQQPSHIPHDKPSNAPIISFGFGGKLVIHTPSSDSLDSPFTNSAVKSTPSSVAIYNLSTLLPPNLGAKFPGPLLGNTQTKKNQVVEYLDARISEEGFTNDQSKLTLLRVVKVLLLNNGVFSSKISQEIRQALLPDSEPRESSHKRAPSGLQITVPADETSPHIKPFPSSQTPYLVSSELNDEGDSTVATYTTTSKALNILQELLVKGQKRDAVYFALENQMWSHALIISSCVDKELWSESVNALTSHELGEGWDSLRVAYNLFAGTLNNSTPRASNWNMTAATLVSNLDSMDAQIALSNLGDKLINEGDIHAGHTCYLLAADTQKLKLLGYTGEGSDIDACRLTEILEYAYSLNPQHKKGDYVGLPHLQSHKLLHAWELTELDEISDANRYCEAIATTIKMSKGSPYYHPDLFIELKELSDRLSSRGDNNDKSWITKKMVRPSLDTLWNSMEGRLTKFIVGNDEDSQTPVAKSNEAAKDVGPFAQFTSIDESSTNGKLSRAASALDLPNWNGISDRRVSDSPAYLSPEMVYSQPRAASAMGGLAGMDGNAPGAYGRGPPVSTSNSLNSGASFNEDITPVATSFGAATATNKMPPPPPPPSALKSPFGHTDVPSEDFNAPEEIDENEGGNFISLMDSMSAPIIPSANGTAYMPTNNRTIDEIDELDEDDDLGFGNDSTKKAKEKRDKELKEKAAVNGGGFQAPAPDQVTQPGQKGPQPSAPQPPPAPASGWFSRSNTPVPEEKKPAEKRPELKQSASSSWLSRWWKKDDQQGNGPVKAKLGEQSSFYYDPAQKRWVNKNSDASSGSSPKMPPPPPRANTTSPGVGRPPAGRGSALKNSVSMDLKGGLSSSSATSAPLPARSPVAPPGPPAGPPTRPSSTTPGPMASSTSPPPPGSGQPTGRKAKKGGRPKYVAVNI